ncbi:unnamed protein product [Medioppia subpectinata]|uniref:Cytochrome b561 domain-containing protein n=1 Tax=Medioppia subpectinata TaxID=1979941 RepID=A0A7R9LKD9_9ACAR|nr:unnamed protein product [Medioppia subpectinata]CAG2119534.1 unnamed protein product [Medioppia subpectinata]
MAKHSNAGQSQQPGRRTLMQTIGLYTLYLLTQVLGIGMISLGCLWVNKHLGGMKLDGTPEQLFNYHPVLMATGMLFINANGILFYRTGGCLKYSTQKFIHFLVQLTGLGVTLAGAYAAYTYHTLKHIPHYYSLHSWLGGALIVTQASGTLGAFFVFLWPQGSYGFKRAVLPLHTFVGAVGFVLAAGVAITGVTEKALFSLTSKGQEYRDLPAPALLLNAFGVSIVLFVISVVYLLTRSDYKRPDVAVDRKKD